MEYKSDRMLILPTLLLCARAHVCPAENVAATCESHFGYDELFTFAMRKVVNRDCITTCEL